jgi:small conductance mechanosensitive channel
LVNPHIVSSGAASAGTPPAFVGATVASALGAAAQRLARLPPREALINVAITVLIVGAAFAFVRAADWLLRRTVKKLADQGLVSGDQAGRGPKIAALTWGLTKLAVTVLAALLVLEVWGFHPLAWLGGARGAAMARAGVMILIGVGGVEMGGRVIDRLFLGLEHRSRDHRRAAQFHTLAPIVKGLATGLLSILIGLTVLSELGARIGPLLAGAGVVGVALGFGAQTLVKDFITGVFLIVEDIVSVGDTVKIGAFGGTVETMTLRTIRLRDFDGTLHVFPYSEAQVIHNQTKSVSYAVIAPQISYLSDIETARALMREVDEALRAEAPYSEMILAPLEIVGVDQFTDVGVVLKSRIKTRPGDQWKIGREFQLRMKLAFDDHGVEIGYPNIDADRTVRRGRDDDGGGDRPRPSPSQASADVQGAGEGDDPAAGGQQRLVGQGEGNAHMALGAGSKGVGGQDGDRLPLQQPLGEGH